MELNCCEYSIKTPGDVQLVSPKHVELNIKIKLRNSASYCLLLYEYSFFYFFCSFFVLPLVN